MKFLTKILIFCVLADFLFAFKIPQNAHNAELSCMFQAQRLQSDWNEQEWELCSQQFKGLDTLLPHPPITIQEGENKATLLFITNKNNKTIMLLLNNDTMLITPNIIDEFNAVKAAFFTFLENKKHICVIDNKDNLYTTTCYEIEHKDKQINLSVLVKVLNFDCKGVCKDYNANSIKQYLHENPQGFMILGI